MLRNRNHLWGAAAALLLLAACGTDPVETKTNRATEEDDEADDEQSDDSSDDDAPPAKNKDAGKPGSTSGGKDAGTAKADAGATAGGKSDAAVVGEKGGNIPCAVDKIVETHCRSCHGEKPAFTATFSLTTLAHFQGPGDTDPSKKMHEVALTRVNGMGAKRMPPTSAKALPAADLKTLTDWLAGGAKSGDACTGGDTSMPGPTSPGDIPIAGPGGNAHATPLKYEDPELKCYPLTAFASGDRKKPYSVPTTPDLYVAFNLKAPWSGKQYVRSFRSIIDNSEVLHHWLLFKQSTGGSDSVQPNALGAHPDGIMLYGWAPGGDDLYLDTDVAMEVDSSVLYQLELHYNNKTGSPKPDASGVEMCVTPTKPEHVAGLSWVGTDAIAGTQAVGRCAHGSSQPIHLIVAQPHMHTKGKNMKVVVTRKGGMKETIHDEPFDFNNQRSYIFNNMLINPGDVMETTCDYSTSAVFGKATNDEMCYFFSIHWPAGELSSLGVGTIIHGANSCMDI